MTLELLDSLSLPGGGLNEDAFGHQADAAVVLDGATPLGDPLMPGNSDAAWLAQFGARRLLAHVRDGDGARKALRGALADAEKSFQALRLRAQEHVWQTPAASMMFLVAASDDPPPLRVRSTQAGEVAEASEAQPSGSEGRRGLNIEFLWYGDCAALVAQGDGPVTVVGQVFDSKSGESDAARRAAQASNKPSTQRQHHLDDLRARRDRINSGNSWLFTPVEKAAAHAARRVMALAPGTHILLASDGFLALASDYGAYSADSLMQAARTRGLPALAEELRAIEQADADGVKFPRFKTSDDATALLLRVV